MGCLFSRPSTVDAGHSVSSAGAGAVASKKGSRRATAPSESSSKQMLLSSAGSAVPQDQVTPSSISSAVPQDQVTPSSISSAVPQGQTEADPTTSAGEVARDEGGATSGEPESEAAAEGGVVQGAKHCTPEELSLATGGFSPKQSLGRGSFGEVWKGKLSWAPGPSDPQGFNVAVKRLFAEEVKHGRILWMREAEHLLRLGSEHPNMPTLLGYNYRQNLLVFPLYQNGNLKEALTGTRLVLTWEQRVSIARECAGALKFLHARGVMHRSVKPSNILLDAELRAHVSDFGLAKDSEDGFKDSVGSSLMGDLGYMDPEYWATLTPSPMNDVYSLGVVFLELIAGQDDATGRLKEWSQHSTALTLLNRKMDRRLDGKFSREEAEKLFTLACECMQPDLKKRPTMSRVHKRLKALSSQTPEQAAPSPSSEATGQDQ